MGLPKIKKNISTSPVREGIHGLDSRIPYEYSDYWQDNERVEQIFNEIQKGRGYFPQSVLHEDYDKEFIEFIKNECNLVTLIPDQKRKNLQKKDVPVFFLNIQRWKEFTQTWQLMDKKQVVSMPFITIVRKLDVVRDEKTPNTIPVRRLFPYQYVPTWDGNKKGVDIYKIPQPVPITMTFEVRLFSTKIRDLNKFNKILLRKFASLQCYIKVNGHFTELLLDNVGDESQIDTVDERKFYIQPYTIKLNGYLLDNEEFEIKPAINRVFTVTEVAGTSGYLPRQRAKFSGGT
jgi:hypothetical protein